jgi:CubicO group peptidase (beta-lactamase class C family)
VYQFERGQDELMDLASSLRALRTDDPAAPGVVVMAATATDHAVEASGMAVLEHGVPLTADTLLYGASLAKLVTALCVHRLRIDGRLQLDDPVGRWFPALRDGHRITLRHLLLHRSGLPEYHALRLVGGYTVDDRLERADIRRLVDGMTTWFEPGTQVAYNNTNFAMLAMVVSDITGESFANAARHLVFEPAGLQTAMVKERADAIVDRSAAGYTPAAGGFHRALMGLASTGDGGVWWSGNDLAAMGRWLLTGHPAITAMRERVPLPDGSLPTLATGCTVADDGSWFGGLAEFTGFCAELRVYPAHDVALGAMSNRQDGRLGQRLNSVATSLGIPEPVAADPPPRRPGPRPQGTLVGVGGAPWHFRADDDAHSPGDTLVVTVGALSFHLVEAGNEWRVSEMPSNHAGWEGDEFVLRDGTSERARLHEIGGTPPTAAEMAGLAGWWWCPAAAASLRVTTADDGLMLQRGQTVPEPLEPVGDRAGRWVMAAPWGLLEFDHDGHTGRVILHRAEGLELQRLVRPDPIA